MDKLLGNFFSDDHPILYPYCMVVDAFGGNGKYTPYWYLVDYYTIWTYGYPQSK